MTIENLDEIQQLCLCLIIPFVFKHCVNLKELNVLTSKSKLDTSNIDSLIQSVVPIKLEKLTIINRSPYANKQFIAALLQKCSSTLSSLNFTTPDILHQGLEGIRGSRSLRKLELTSSSYDNGLYLNKSAMAIIESLPNLEELTGI